VFYLPFDSEGLTMGSRGLASRMRWRVRRLALMSPSEVLWRGATRARLELWHRRRRWPHAPCDISRVHDLWRPPATLPPAGVAGLVAAADAIVGGAYHAAGCTFVLDPVDWHLDPQSGVSAPRAFGPLLDYRDPAVAGNCRNIWELNRHQHLSLVAAAYAASCDERYARFVREQLTTWLDQNPWPLGVNWQSPLEMALRLISWLWIWRLLDGSPERERLFGPSGLLWPAIYRHQTVVAALRSRGSSANNHLIGEMAGLYVSSVAWPVFDESRTWARRARMVLHDEAVRQYFASGLNREQSFGYHVFTTELLALAGLEGQRHGDAFSTGYLQGLGRAVAAAAAQLTDGGVAPRYGDADEATAVDLGQRRSGLDWLGALAASWLGQPSASRAEPNEILLAAALLMGSDVGAAAGSDAPSALAMPGAPPTEPVAPGTIAYPDAGLFVMRSRAAGRILCIADAGPLGYLSIAAHGHADALSFTVTVDDDELLVDPGTFTYHYDPLWREYFRGTSAHNTVTVDGQSQSVADGPFMWSRKAETTVLRWESTAHGAVLEAAHNGYERLPDPVNHRRTLALDKGVLSVVDELAGRMSHAVEWRLHLAPGCKADLAADRCEVVGKRHRLTIRLDPGLSWHLHTGDDQGGWYSGSLNRREEATTLVGTACVVLPLRLDHVIEVCK
jgi:hypothetical protein